MLPRLRIDLAEGAGPIEPRRLFGSAVGDVWLEIGFGAGEHLLAQARSHPEVGFIGCEPYVNGIAALLAAIAEGGGDTIRIFPDDARLLIKSLAPASVGRVFVLFPDPWPKTRHHGRRFIAPATLRDLARILRPGGELRLASDHGGYVRWMLEHVTRNPSFLWLARGPGDWRTRPGDGVATRYEEKAASRDVACTYLRFVRRNGPAAANG